MTAKERMIGLDVPTLQRQVEEKRQRELAEKETSQEFDKLALMVDTHLSVVEIAKQKAQREREIKAKEYSLEHHGKGTRREYEISDPDLLKKQQPTRRGDDDPNLGVSSIQILTGEDIMKRERERQQQKQQKAWIEQQIYEKNLRDEMQKSDDAEYDATVSTINQMRGAIECEEDRIRRELGKRIQSHNFQQASDRKSRSMQEAEEMDRVNAAEIEYNLNNSMLNSAPVKVKAGEWQKTGSTMEERIEARNAQQAQAMEDQEKKRRQQELEMQRDQETESTRRLLLAMEEQRRRDIKHQREENARENQRLGEEQRQRRQEAGKVKLEMGNIFAE